MNKLAFALSLACLFAPALARAQNAYITNSGDSTVSVINTATNTVVGSPIPVGSVPQGVAVTPDGSKVYVANSLGNTLSVIATATNSVVATIPVGTTPIGVAVTPDGTKVYVANEGGNTVSVINTATNTVVGSPIPVGTFPVGVAVTPDGSKVYVTNFSSNTVSVIATATNTVVATVPIVGGPFAGGPFGVAVTPDGSKVYVANQVGITVSVIATATNTVVATIPVVGEPTGVAVTPDGSKLYVTNTDGNTVSVIAPATNMVVGSPITVGSEPFAFGLFIQPATGVFSTFTAKLSVSSFQPKFTLVSNFTLGSTSNGINPASEAVTLKIGTFTVNIPPGSFTSTTPGTYAFSGVISGLTINASITHTGGRRTPSMRRPTPISQGRKAPRPSRSPSATIQARPRRGSSESGP